MLRDDASQHPRAETLLNQEHVIGDGCGEHFFRQLIDYAPPPFDEGRAADRAVDGELAEVMDRPIAW